MFSLKDFGVPTKPIIFRNVIRTCQTFKIERFALGINYFRKTLWTLMFIRILKTSFCLQVTVISREIKWKPLKNKFVSFYNNYSYIQ